MTQKTVLLLKRIVSEAGFTKKEFDGIMLAIRRELWPPKGKNPNEIIDSNDTWVEALNIQNEVSGILYNSAYPMTFSEIAALLPWCLNCDVAKALSILVKNKRFQMAEANGKNVYYPTIKAGE